MSKNTLKAEKRKIFGRKIKSLRREGILPANIYGKKVKSLAIQFPQKGFNEVYKEIGETGILEIMIGKEKKPVLVHNVQVDPVTDVPLHVDFLQINLKEKVTADVPIELIGESPAEKRGLGTVVQYLNEIEVEALPAKLPEKFEVDLSGLKEVDDSTMVKDLKVDTKTVEIKTDIEQMIVKVEPPQKEEEVIAPPAEEEEEVVEGEAPVEGEEKAPEEGAEAKPEEEEKKE